MLQIITGKFYKSSDCYETLHRATFYTNYRTMIRANRLQTSVATLLPMTGLDGLATMACEINERIEKPANGPGVMISTGGATLLNDFSAVTAFALNITCTPDPDLTRRLLSSERPSLGVEGVPSKFVKRTFDRQIISRDHDGQILAQFVDQLVALKRKQFEASMRSIRQYVTGLHRLADNLSLSYALLVMSIESLAQEFDGHIAQWSDYDDRRRTKIDEALSGASSETRNKVRSTLLEIEHVALSRRFRDFALAHIAPSFFREEADAVPNAISRADITLALQQAYNIRSSYVHALREIPKQLTIPEMPEMFEVDDRPALGISGIARLARHVITQFVLRGERVDEEDFDYRHSFPNVVTLKLSSEYWIANTGDFSYKHGPLKLGAFIEQVTSAILLRAAGAKLTDIRPVLEKIEEVVPGLREAGQRLPLLTLYFLFHHFAPPEFHCKEWPRLINDFEEDFEPPSIESFVARLLSDQEIDWDVDAFEQLQVQYFRTRHRYEVTSIGRTLEAALLLTIAERHRIMGNEKRCRDLISHAVDVHPKCAQLRAYERALMEAPLKEIFWKEIILPDRKAVSDTPTSE